jgi:thiamine-phosphate pyrophosphorylase
MDRAERLDLRSGDPQDLNRIMPAEGAMPDLDPRSLGVYVVTSATLIPGRGHREIARAAIEGGATAIQLRAPEMGDEELGAVAAELASWCREAGVLFIVNDRLDVAVGSGADGVHLGQKDGIERARERLGPERVLGISAEDAAQASAAAEADADYLGVTLWATSTKPEAHGIGLVGLAAVARDPGLPVVGIGGVDAGNARDVLAAGAAGIAVVSAVAASPDPVAATRELRLIVDGYRNQEGTRP